MSTKTLICIACLLLFSCGIARGDQLSTLFLPAHIESDNGVVSLHADFGGVDSSGRIPVYLVNRSNTPIALSAATDDFNLKLEYLADDGNWVRAQPHYPQTGCFTRLYQINVMPNHFIVIDGYQRINGEAKQVRYRLRSDEFELVTNIDQGVVASIDIDRAARDVMAIEDGDFELVSGILLDQTYATNDRTVEYGRYIAIDEIAMGRFDLDDSRDVLRQLALLRPDMRRYIDWAIARLDAMAKKAEQ